MIKFIEKANLPQGRVKSLICGSDDRLILNFFAENGIKVYRNEKNNSIDPSVSLHADMSAIHIGENAIVLDKNQCRLKKELIKNGFAVHETKSEIKGYYPDDVKLNFTVLNDFVVGNFKNADESLLKLISHLDMISVNQGYCKCSMLVLSDKAVITDDSSIHCKMLENGIESLLIAKGDVYLKGHDYGFIGGASGKIANDKVVFFGDIKRHRDFEIINDFLLKHGCSYVCTDDSPLRDIGGIIPLTEAY